MIKNAHLKPQNSIIFNRQTLETFSLKSEIRECPLPTL